MAVISNWTHPFTRRHSRPYVFALDFSGDLLTTKAAVILMALESVFLALPAVWARHLPLWDAGGHIARIALLNGVLVHGQQIPAYAAAPLWLPNVAFDIIGIGLTQLMNAEVAGRLFLAVSQIMTFIGVVALNRVLIGRWSLFPFVVGLFIYNLVTAYGFLNYIFGVGLAFVFLALRAHLLRSRPVLGYVIGAVLGLVLLFAHLYALGIYGVLWFGICLDDILQRRARYSDVVKRNLEFVPALTLLATMRTGEIFDYHYYANVIEYKVQYLLRFMMSATPWADVAFVVAAALLVFLFAFRASVRVHAMLPGAILLFVIYWIMPSRLQTSWFADVRLPITIVFAVLAGLDVKVRGFPGRTLLVAAIAVGFCAKQFLIGQYWHRLEQPIDAVISAINKLPADAVVIDADCATEAKGDLEKMYARYAPPQHHIMELSALTGPMRFFSSFWAEPAAQPLRVRPEYKPYYDLSEKFGESNRCDRYGASRLVSVIRQEADVQVARGNIHPHVYFMAWHEKAVSDVSPGGWLVTTTPIGNLYQVAQP